MSSTFVSTLIDSLDDLGVERTRTTAADFPDALAGAIDAPAVGTPLPFDGVSLDGTEVTVPPTPGELRDAKTGITPTSGGIAEYGTVVIESRPEGDELVSLYPERHVAVLRESDLVAGIDDGWPATGGGDDNGSPATGGGDDDGSPATGGGDDNGSPATGAGDDDATDSLREQFAAGRDSAVLATGVSATADMGATVEGVHGPSEVHVILLTDR